MPREVVGARNRNAARSGAAAASTRPSPPPRPGPEQYLFPPPESAMVADEDQATQHEYVVAIFRRVAQTADDRWLRPRVPQGGNTAHLNRIASMLDFIVSFWLPDEVCVVVAFLERGQQLGRLGFRCFAGQAGAAPFAARRNVAKGVESPRSVLRKPPWVSIAHQTTFDERTEHHVIHSRRPGRGVKPAAPPPPGSRKPATRRATRDSAAARRAAD